MKIKLHIVRLTVLSSHHLFFIIYSGTKSLKQQNVYICVSFYHVKRYIALEPFKHLFSKERKVNLV